MIRRAGGFVFGLAVLAVLSGAAVGVDWVHRSLPILDGELQLPCLDAPATLERDANGVPTVLAASREDLSCAIGFLHGQDRFFQMDLMRRRAEGSLAELVGPAALEADRGIRIHRFGALAKTEVGALPEADRVHLQRYAAGINAGLGELDAAPPEYALLRSRPKPWQVEDSMLVAYAMYALLHEPVGGIDRARGQLREAFPASLAEFLDPVRTVWDAEVAPSEGEVPEIPGPEIFDLRTVESLRETAAIRLDHVERSVPGSNSMAVSGRRTTDGRALLANDTHLPLGMPNTWYRIVAKVERTNRTLAGITLPGVPAFIAGSNDFIAWGVTNSQGDFSDVVRLNLDPRDPQRYRLPDGSYEAFTSHSDRIPVLGSEPVSFEYRWTRWGPVVGEGTALAWIAHRPGSVNLEMLQLEEATSVHHALVIAAGSRIPPQNFLVADRDGNIGWTVIGPMPDRGSDGRVPRPWDLEGAAWRGLLAAEDYPRVINPPGGLLWTANNRVVGGESLRLIGDGGFDLGARAGTLRDGMMQLEQPIDEQAMLDVQLDDRAPLIAGWYERLMQHLDGREPDTEREAVAMEALGSTWTGRASTDSAAYRIARAFRHYTADRVFEPFDRLMPGGEKALPVRAATHQWEGPLTALVEARPAHLLNPRFESWDALLEDAAAQAMQLVDRDGTISVDHARWGQRNRVRIQHPLAQAVPALSRWLDAPVEELPGDGNLARVQSPTFGASQRLVVAPGALNRGLFHMPGGTSGHFLSPFYLAGHRDWVEGRPSPLLGGGARHRLRLNSGGLR